MKIFLLSFVISTFAFVSIACFSTKFGGAANTSSSFQANNSLDKQITYASESKNEGNKNKVNQIIENDFVKSKGANRAGKCQPSEVPSGSGASENTNMSEILPEPKTREEFDEWLSFSGGLQLAQLKDRSEIRQYFDGGDFNNDGCQDIVLIVEGKEGNTGKKDLENNSVEITVKNLRTNAVFEGGDVKKLPFAPQFEAQIKPQQKIALLVVLGGEKGWSWKHGGRGRTFILYDSIYQTTKTKDITDVSTVFGVIEKNKPNEDYDDLLYLFPPNARGDCIHTELEIQRKGVEYVDATKRNLICFNGKNFFAKNLPDTKLYPE
jgi:hypothetical protein